MSISNMEVTLTPRTNAKSYNVQMNKATFDVLSLIFEFKVASSWHIARFIDQRDRSKYLYLKLRRMWQAGLLESCKVYSNSRSGMPVYYLLSSEGLKVLAEQGVYDERHLEGYPDATSLISWSILRHEAQVVELASMEVKNRSKSFDIRFKGELSSGSHDFRSDHSIEVFTPDYTVFYVMGEREFCIYSEFERTAKSKEAMIGKIQRYISHLSPEECARCTLRIIFQTPNMEQSFWLNIIGNGANFLQKIRILTTNLLLIEKYEQFLEPIYASENTVKLMKEGRLEVDISSRIKLFPFL